MYRQYSLVRLDDYMEIRPLNHLEAILSFMDFTLLHQHYPYNPHKRGPKGYDKEHLLRNLIGMQVQQLPEIKSLVDRIKMTLYTYMSFNFFKNFITRNLKTIT